jgi:hypothetical protein
MTESNLTSTEFEAKETAGATVLPSAAFGLILLLGQYYSLPMEPLENWTFANTAGTAWEPHTLEVSESDVFSQVHRVYEHLLREQVELDPVSKKALYANLWDLYT